MVLFISKYGYKYRYKMFLSSGFPVGRLVLRAGTILYRARKITDNLPWLQSYKCADTDKTGLYFSDDPILCIGMGIEYQSDVVLGRFRLLRSIALYNGKYSFRNIAPERYFREDGSFICHVNATKEENINHYDRNMLPIYKDRDIVYVTDGSNLNEIFICDADLQYLEFEYAKTLSLDCIKKYIRYGNESFANFQNRSGAMCQKN